MKIKKILVPVMSAVLVAAVAATVIILTKGDLSSGAAGAEDLMKDVKSSTEPAKTGSQTQATEKSDFQSAAVDFSLKLFRSSFEKGKNTMVSPPSVFLALGLTENGASGDTLKEFESVLGGGKLTRDQLNGYYQNYMKTITDVKQDTKLSVANSIWYRNNFVPKQEFLQANADYFGADTFKLNFDSAGAPDKINQWVDKNTNHLIKKMVDEIDPLTQMYLINTVYFNGKWAFPFDREGNYQDDFTLSGGEKIKTDYMRGTETLSYQKTDAYEMVLLPYNDFNFQFAAILPKEGTDIQDFVKSLNGETIRSMTNLRDKGTNVFLTIPKFKSEYEIELNDPLKSMGLRKAFEPGAADFSAMGSMEGQNETSLFISKVKHKTFIKVDELGTEAGAATSVEIKATSMPLETVTFTLNRPFVYCIIDNATGIPLFLGVMEDPS